MEPEVYHLFEKYINNDLTESEKEGFDKRITDDPEFADAFHAYQDIYAHLAAKENRQAGEMELRKSLKDLSDEFLTTEIAEKPVKVIPIKRYYQLAAASVVIILGTLFFLNREGSTSLYSQYANYEALALAERGEEDSLTVLAEDYFNSGQFAEAADLLAKLADQDPENTEVKLYLGIALTETDRFDRAIALFTEIRSSGSIFQNKATWYMALNYLKQGETEATEALLKEIPEGAVEYGKARQLLEEL